MTTPEKKIKRVVTVVTTYYTDGTKDVQRKTTTYKEPNAKQRKAIERLRNQNKKALE